MEDFAGFIGWVICVCWVIALLNYFVKWIFKTWIVKLPKESGIRALYQLLMKIIVKYHRLFGTVAVTFAVVHMALQLVYDTLSITGIVAVAVIVLSGVTGIALSVKRRNGVLLAHRVFTFASLICLAIHVLVAG